jgi:cyclic pyranopterin phosphate synthase
VRLTADGQLRTCLFSLEDHDLRGPMRAGASDDDLAAIIEAAVGAKWAGHAIGQVTFIRPRRSMSQIGG